MPIKKVDGRTGAILFKRTPEEKKVKLMLKNQDSLKKENEDLKKRMSSIESLFKKLKAKKVVE